MHFIYCQDCRRSGIGPARGCLMLIANNQTLVDSLYITYLTFTLLLVIITE